MLHIVWSLVTGFVIGLLGRAVMPGADHMSFLMTALLGIGGSFVGGFIGRLVNRPAEGVAFHPAGFLGSVLGAALLLWLARFTGS